MVAFNPQGLVTVAKWWQLIPLDVLLIMIEGIGDAKMARQLGHCQQGQNLFQCAHLTHPSASRLSKNNFSSQSHKKGIA
jgi:hypothetical protein